MWFFYFYRCESLGIEVRDYKEKLLKIEETLAKTNEEKEKATQSYKKLQDEIKAKESKWATESQVSFCLILFDFYTIFLYFL